MIPGFFWARKLGKYFFGWLDLSRDFWVFKAIWRFLVVPAYPDHLVLQIKFSQIKYMLYHLMLSGNFKCSQILGFFEGGLLEALEIFLGFDFCLYSIIPVTWNPEYPPGTVLSYKLLRLEMFKNYCSFTALHTSFPSIIVLIRKLIHFYFHKN